MRHQQNEKDILVLQPGAGRTYDCGTMTAIFKADENETAEKYSVSEWWLEPDCEGPHPHSHADYDELFYVLEGTVSFLVGEEWMDACKGSFIRLPVNTTHSFTNKTDKKSRISQLQNAWRLRARNAGDSKMV
jgi:quercetin dioxygenase-like cupin family protein